MHKCVCTLVILKFQDRRADLYIMAQAYYIFVLREIGCSAIDVATTLLIHIRVINTFS